MDTIIVKTKEDMDRILEWAVDSRELFENGPEFKIPFQKGELLMPYDGCRLEFQCEAERLVRFKLRAIPEAFGPLKWTEERTGEDFALGGFLFNVETLDISEKRFDMSDAFAKIAMSNEREGEVFKELAIEWLVLMLLAVYYRPQFESKKQVEASSASGKKAKRTKTLYTRTYVIGNDLTEDLPKAVKRRAKPDHEYGVRGHYRRYKSGKVAWVRPHIRCKGRKPGDGNTYVAKIADEK